MAKGEIYPTFSFPILAVEVQNFVGRILKMGEIIGASRFDFEWSFVQRTEARDNFERFSRIKLPITNGSAKREFVLTMKSSLKQMLTFGELNRSYYLERGVKRIGKTVDKAYSSA